MAVSAMSATIRRSLSPEAALMSRTAGALSLVVGGDVADDGVRDECQPPLPAAAGSVLWGLL